MREAPKDRRILVLAPGRDGLPALVIPATWHPDAGFTVDEFRDAAAWKEEAMRTHDYDPQVAIAIGHHFWNCKDDAEAERLGAGAARDVYKRLALHT